MYLVALKDTVGEEEINLALRDAMEHYANFVMPCGKVETWGPYSDSWRCRFGEIVWLLSRLSPYTRLSENTLEGLRENAKSQYASYSKHEYEAYCTRMNESIGAHSSDVTWLRDKRKEERNWIFRKLISPWVPNRAKRH